MRITSARASTRLPIDTRGGCRMVVEVQFTEGTLGRTVEYTVRVD